MNILIDVLEFGEIEVELLEEFAPKTVANFIKLVEENYFQNSGFHRIISGFMIQGGIGKTPNIPITGEFASNGFKNDLKHTRGVISMARTNDPNSASSQFFIMHEDSPHLDGAYAAFGKVTKGLDVVDRIANVKTNMMDGPLEKVVINNIHYYINKDSQLAILIFSYLISKYLVSSFFSFGTSILKIPSSYLALKSSIPTSPT